MARDLRLLTDEQWKRIEPLLTEEEAIRYLRLDTIRGLKNPAETLARYRATGLLRGTQVSKSIFYRRIELDRFLDRLTTENPR
jgi:transposase